VEEDVNVTLLPEQIVVGLPVMIGIEGCGFTVISTALLAVPHPGAVAVIEYLTTAELPEILLSVWEIIGPDPALKPLAVPDCRLGVHVKEAPVMLLNIWISVASPEQIVCAKGLEDTVSARPGVTVTLLVAEQPLAGIVSLR
jgi:hypothetical protein